MWLFFLIGALPGDIMVSSDLRQVVPIAGVYRRLSLTDRARESHCSLIFLFGRYRVASFRVVFLIKIIRSYWIILSSPFRSQIVCACSDIVSRRYSAGACEPVLFISFLCHDIFITSAPFIR